MTYPLQVLFQRFMDASVCLFFADAVAEISSASENLSCIAFERLLELRVAW